MFFMQLRAVTATAHAMSAQSLFPGVFVAARNGPFRDTVFLRDFLQSRLM
jgi:hypothetical protein